MIQTALTNAKWYGAPTSLFCAPTSVTGINLGYWDTLSGACQPSTTTPLFTRPDEYIQKLTTDMSTTCQFYAGQKGGKPVAVAGGAYNSVAGPDARNDVEGCCWWGRGVIQLTGRCNVGKLNKVLIGSGFLKDGDDLCKDPGIICGSKYPTLKWISGMIFWCSEVMSYNEEGYSYTDDLKKFASMMEKDAQGTVSNMSWTNGTFIYSVSGIVNRGCPSPGKGCDEFGAVEIRRMCFFQNVLAILFGVSPPLPMSQCKHDD
jgi:hypothetical protein